MTIIHPILGECGLDICVKDSVVDCFIEYGYSFKFHRRLRDDEVARIQKDFEGEIQLWAYSEGGAKYHN
jgi:hypothetical protein